MLDDVDTWLKVVIIAVVALLLLAVIAVVVVIVLAAVLGSFVVGIGEEATLVVAACGPTTGRRVRRALDGPGPDSRSAGATGRAASSK